MLRGSSRCVRGSDIARNIKTMVLRKLAEAIFKRKHSRKLRLWSRKLCGSPRGTWGLRQAVLKGINDTAHLCPLFKQMTQMTDFCGSWLVGFLISQELTIWFSLLFAAKKHKRIVQPRLKTSVLFVRFLWSLVKVEPDESESSWKLLTFTFRRQLWQEETKQVQLNI